MNSNLTFAKRAMTLVFLLLITCALAAQASGAAKPKPMGYIYQQCTSKTNCTYNGSTNVKQTKLSISSTNICATGGAALGQLGQITVKSNGKFSVNKTVSATNYQTYKTSQVTVNISGKLKKGKSVKGTLKITTDASDCANDTGVSNSFNMKYKGPYYGG
jgi:hypothetical protein